MIEWLPLAGLLVAVGWFTVKAALERVEAVLQEQAQERFWNDGKTSTGVWALELRALVGGDGVTETSSVVPLDADLRMIQPRDVLGRHRDPARVKAGSIPPPRRPKRGHRHEGLHEPERT